MLKELEDLHKACFPDKNWSAQDFMDLKKSGCDIIASQNSFVVWRVIADEAEIITIGVHPDVRNTGIATALLTLVENDVRNRGGKKIFLEVADNNIAARTLYEHKGYTQVAVRAKYYGNVDAILMEKIL